MNKNIKLPSTYGLTAGEECLKRQPNRVWTYDAVLLMILASAFCAWVLVNLPMPEGAAAQPRNNYEACEQWRAGIRTIENVPEGEVGKACEVMAIGAAKER